MRTCIKCHTDRFHDDFPIHDGKFGNVCKPCRKTARITRAKAHKLRHLVSYNPPTVKRCPSCTQVLPAAAFRVNLTRADGLASACRFCHSRQCHKSRRRNPETVQQYVQRRTELEHNAPGIEPTEDELRELVLSFDGKCAICEVQQATGFDHMTSLKRGGSRSISNLQPCCVSCNGSKGSMTMEEFMSHPSFGRIRQVYRLTVASDYDTQE